MSATSQREVAEIVRRWLAAVSRGDREGIREHHAEDVLMFDFPDTVRGIAEYDRTWDFFFDSQRGPITFSPSDVAATAGDNVAFVTCEVHCEGTTAGPLDFRLTVGLEKHDGEWTITHEHHSLPTTDQKFVMPEKQA
jgi:ketosteroid isomerase-like protein